MRTPGEPSATTRLDFRSTPTRHRHFAPSFDEANPILRSTAGLAVTRWAAGAAEVLSSDEFMNIVFLPRLCPSASPSVAMKMYVRRPKPVSAHRSGRIGGIGQKSAQIVVPGRATMASRAIAVVWGAASAPMWGRAKVAHAVPRQNTPPCHVR